MQNTTNNRMKSPDSDAPFHNPNTSTFFWGVTKHAPKRASKTRNNTTASCEDIYSGLSDEELKTIEYMACTNHAVKKW